MQPEDRRTAATYAAIVGTTALVSALAMVFLVFGNQGWVANAGDPYDYGQIARGFMEHGFDKLTRRAAMLYPHLLWGMYALGLGNAAVQLLHCALHVGTCLLVFSMGRRLFDLRTALIAGIATALHPMGLRYIADLHTETLLIFMCTLLVWCAIRFYDRPTIASGIRMGAVAMLGALTKGVLLPVAVAFGSIALVRGYRQGGLTARPVLATLAMFLTMGAIVAPWTYRNYQVSGRFVLITPGTPDAFLRGYIFTRYEFITLQRPPYVDAENESNALFHKIAREAGTRWELDEVADDDNNGKVMKAMIVKHPFLTVKKVAIGLFTFWYEMTSLRNSLVPGVLALVAWAFAFVGLKRAWRESRPAWLVLLPIVVLNVFVATLVPLGRYSVPILPCLMLLGAFGVSTLLERRRQPAAVATDLRRVQTATAA